VEPWANEELFAFRDPRQGLPTEGLSKKDQQLFDEGLVAIRARRYLAAERLLRPQQGVRRPHAIELLWAYVSIALGHREEARAGLDRLLASGSPMVAAWEARGDLRSARGELRLALDDYRSAQRLSPQDERLARRIEDVRRGLVAQRRDDADRAFAANELSAARKVGLSLIELSPTSPDGFLILSRAAELGGNPEDAYVWAWKARALNEKSRDLTAVVAELAMKTRRFNEAMSLFDDLARTDSSYRSKAEQAKLEFEIQNMPESAGRAARSARLTRGQFAALLWHLVPEVRQAPAGVATEVAVDVVDRADRQPLLRAIALGFFTISKETHRVGVETGVSRSELAVLLRHLASFLSRGRNGSGCLDAEAPTPAELVECGILVDSTSRTVIGKEAVRAIQRAARAGREGASR